jgi:uroporphyrinogen-III synthase
MSALAGRTVLVTRPAERSGKFVKLLDELGAHSIVAPTISIEPSRSSALTGALNDLARGHFEWIVLTSPATVAMLGDRVRDPSNVRARAAAIGDGTAEAFRRWAGRDPDLQPETFTTSGLARHFPRGEGAVLCARADIAPDGLERALESKGWSPVRVDAYRTRFPASLSEEARIALGRGEVDAMTFTSASTVRGFVRAAPVVRGSPKIVCIGPVTTKEARSHGFKVHAVANPHTTEGVVAALERLFARTPRAKATRGASPPMG